jgi:predicted nucleic acid-binding protein
MAGARLLLDTVFVQALLNRNDQYHARATALLPEVRNARGVWVTEAVLIEVANALSAFDRVGAARFIEHCYTTPNLHVVTVRTPLLHEGLQLFAARPDKQWSLTDCISFVVMKENDLTDAATADRHFVQAGFRALLLEPQT